MIPRRGQLTNQSFTSRAYALTAHTSIVGWMLRSESTRTCMFLRWSNEKRFYVILKPLPDLILYAFMSSTSENLDHRRCRPCFESCFESKRVSVYTGTKLVGEMSQGLPSRGLCVFPNHLPLIRIERQGYGIPDFLPRCFHQPMFIRRVFSQ